METLKFHHSGISLVNKHYYVMKDASDANGFKINTYFMKQPDLYYFEAIKMTSQAYSNFAGRIRAAGEYPL